MSDIIFIEGYNLDSNCYLINGNTLVDTGAGQNKEYLFSKLAKGNKICSTNSLGIFHNT